MFDKTKSKILNNALVRVMFWNFVIGLTIFIIMGPKDEYKNEIQPVNIIGLLIIIVMWVYSLLNLWSCKCN